MTKRILCLVLAIISVMTAAADTGKYDELVHRSGSWTSQKLMLSADSLLKNGAEDEAIVLYMIVTSRYRHQNPPREKAKCAEAFLRMGDIHYAEGNYSNALKAYVEGLRISDSLPDKPFISVFYKNMGNTYNELHSYEMGRYLYKKGLKYALEHNDTDTQYKLLQNLAGVSILLDDTSAAHHYYNEMKGMAAKPSDAGDYMEEFILALILKGEHRYKDSIRHFIQLAKTATSKGLSARYICDAYDEIAKINIETGDTDTAITYLEKCVTLAEKSGILHRYATALKHLFTLYEENGHTNIAQKIKDKYLHLRDSIDNQQQLDNAKNQQFLYEMEKTEKAITELNRAQRESEFMIERQRLIMICSFAGILIVLALLYYFYRQKQRLSNSYRALYTLNRQLADTHKESKKHQEYIKGVIELQADEIAELKRQLSNKEVLSSHDKVLDERNNKDIANDQASPAAGKYRSSNLRDEQRDKLAADIIEIMETNKAFTSPDFSLGIIADMLDSNVKYISQVINEVFQKNFNTFVNDYRIRLACDRFADVEHYGHYSIKGIGESVGFKSHTSFNNAFKKNTGISPSVYQKLSMEEAKKISEPHKMA